MSPSTFNSATERRSPSSRRWTPPSPTELASRFPQLEIVELLGQGATGAVYKVRQLDLDRWAALKILSDDVAEDSSFAERFQREARALALLSHQHIVIVYEFGQKNGVYFLLMEYVDGVNLRQAIRAQQITTQEALAIVVQICDALQFAHEEGVIHRDIKPENILIDKRGRVKIADFGLAKLLGRSFDVPTLTGTHQVMGTPVYMSPEQMEGTRTVDHRADIFSLGVVFYELLTGELPLGRFAPPSQKYQLDIRLDDVVLRSLEKEPDRRYQKASEVRHDVHSIRTQKPASNAAPVRSRSFREGWRVRTSLLGVVLVGIIGAAYVIDPGTFNLKNRVLTSRVPPSLAANPVRFPNHVQQRPSASAPFESDFIHRAGMGGTMFSGPESVAAAQVRDVRSRDMVVQTIDGKAILSPRVDGANWGFVEISGAQRTTIDRIMTEIHQKYLEIEKQHTHRVIHPDGTQESIISDLSLERAKLEREFWAAVDSEFSSEFRGFFRQVLPITSDVQRQHPEIFASGLRDEDGTLFQGKGPRRGELIFPFKMRYPQILGWKQIGQELHISINRTATGYRWNLTFKFREFVDTGEAPVLPVGLCRFWNAANLPSTDFAQPAGGTAGPRPDAGRQRDPYLLRKTHRPQIFSAPIEVGGILSTTTIESPAIQDFGPTSELESTLDPDVSAIQDAPSAELNSTLEMSEDPSAVESVDLAPFVEPIEQPDLEKRLNVSDLSLGEAFGRLDQWILEEADFPEFHQRISTLLSRLPKPADQGAVHMKAVQVIFRHIHLRHAGDFSTHLQDVQKHAIEGLRKLRDPLERSELFLVLGQITDRAPEFLANRTTSARWYLKGYAELLPFQLPETMPKLPPVDEAPSSIASADSPANSTTSETTQESDPYGDVTLDQIDLEVRREIFEKLRAQVEITRRLVGRRDEYVAGMKALVIQSRRYDASPDDQWVDVSPDDQWLETLAETILPTKHEVTRLMKLIELNHDGALDRSKQ